MSRAPKRIWWCNRAGGSEKDHTECAYYDNGRCNPGGDGEIVDCDEIPYVPEKGGER